MIIMLILFRAFSQCSRI